MPGPLAALLLPLIESIGASGVAMGSTAAATGTAAGAGAGVAEAVGATAARGAAAGGTSGLSGGFQQVISKVMGTVEPFANAEALGKGVQDSQLVADSIASLMQSIEDNRTRQESLVAGAKGTDSYTGASYDRSQDPEHLSALADLTSKRSELEKQLKAKQGALVDLHARIGQTTNPQKPAELGGGWMGAAATMLPMLGGMFGGGSGNADKGLAAQLAHAPQQAMGPLGALAGKLPGVELTTNMRQAALQPLTDLGVGKAEGEVISGATSFATEHMSNLMDPRKLLSGEALTHMAKLPGLLEEWGVELAHSKDGLRQYNATIAETTARSDYRELMRNIESADRTSGTLGSLTDKTDLLKDKMQPLKDLGTNVLARLLERGIDGLLTLITIAETVGNNIPGMKGALDGLLEANKKQDQDRARLPLVQWTNQVNQRNPRDL